MPPIKGKKMNWSLKRITVLVGAVVLFVLVISGIFTLVYTWQTETKFPPYDFIDADGTKIHYAATGTGRPVVIIHGGGGYIQNFTLSPLYDLMVENYHVILVDRPGLGYSQRPQEDPTIKVQARIIHQVIEELALDEPPIIVGQSWGAGVAMAYALAYPDDLAGIVMLGGHPYYTVNESPDPIYRLVDTPIIGDIVRHTIYTPLGVFLVGPARLKDSTILAPLVAFPETYAEATLRLQIRPDHVKAIAWEHLYLDQTLQEIMPQYSQVDLPIVYVTGALDSKSYEQYGWLVEDIPDIPLIELDSADHYFWFAYPQETAEAVDLAWELVDTH